MIGLSPKLVLAVSGVIVVLVALSLGQEMNRRAQVQKEVQRLEGEVQELEKDIIEMENLNQYFKTDAFQERMAREKLNFRAEGEKVVLIPSDFESPIVKDPAQIEPDQKSVPMLWWDVFFGT